MKSIVQNSLKEIFRPEFLNRLDDIIVFKELSTKEIQSIAEIMLDKLKERLKDIGINASFTKRLTKYIAQKGYSKDFGARPLERAIRTSIEDEIAQKMLEGEIERNENIEIDFYKKLLIKNLDGVKNEQKDKVQV